MEKELNTAAVSKMVKDDRANFPRSSFRYITSPKSGQVYLIMVGHEYKANGDVESPCSQMMLVLDDTKDHELYCNISGTMQYVNHVFVRYAERFVRKKKWNKYRVMLTFLQRNTKFLIVGPCNNGVDGIALIPDGLLLLDMSDAIPKAKTFISYDMLQPLQKAAIAEAKRGNKSMALSSYYTFKELY